MSGSFQDLDFPKSSASPTTATTLNGSNKDTMSDHGADPSTFLTTPSPPTCTSTRINFATSPLPEYSNHFALLISNLLTPTECSQLLQIAEFTTTPPHTWSPAEVNIGNGRQRMILEARNCGRIIWDSFPIAQRLMDRILPHLPEEIVTLKGNAGITGWGPVKRGETWRVSRSNERLRFLKYTSGMYFKEHCDGCYVTPDGKEISFLTVHVYLNGEGEASGTTAARHNMVVKHAGASLPGNDHVINDDKEMGTDTTTSLDNQPLKGGATRFFSPSLPSENTDKCLDFMPKEGACLVFQHKGLVHSGEEVERGVKYTVRSDVMYEMIGG